MIWRFCDIQFAARFACEKRGALKSTGDPLKGPLMNDRANPARNKKEVNGSCCRNDETVEKLSSDYARGNQKGFQPEHGT